MESIVGWHYGRVNRLTLPTALLHGPHPVCVPYLRLNQEKGAPLKSYPVLGQSNFQIFRYGGSHPPRFGHPSGDKLKHSGIFRANWRFSGLFGN